MTEAEWRECADPTRMLEFLRGKASDRKLRLFAVACCRLLFRKVRVGPLYEREVEVAERYADGAASSQELQEVRRYSNSAAEHACMNTTELEDGIVMADCAAGNAAWAATQPGKIMPDDNGVSKARLAAYEGIQASLLRDSFPNPFRFVPLDRAWLTWNDGTIPKIAHGIYNERGFDRMPILADALEDAGCDNAEILNHCRQASDHMRGCWVVDLLLGKE